MKSIRNSLISGGLALLLTVSSLGKQVELNSKQHIESHKRKAIETRIYEKPTRLRNGFKISDDKKEYDIRFMAYKDKKNKRIVIPEWPFPYWSVQVLEGEKEGIYMLSINIPEDSQKKLIEEYLVYNGKDESHKAYPLTDNVDLLKPDYPIKGMTSTITWPKNRDLTIVFEVPKSYQDSFVDAYQRAFKPKVEF